MPDNIHLYDDAELAWRRQGPSPATRRAFGVREEDLRRLPGGAGYNWSDGRLVLKPVGFAPEHNWVCEVYAGWTSDAVRVPEPVAPTSNGDQADHGSAHPDWSFDGWGAHVFVPGRDLDLNTELDRVKEASDAFHHELRDLPRPAFLADRNDPWAYGDRVAWEDAVPAKDPDTERLIERLREHLRPVDLPEQPIHGDVLPNVLAADGMPLAVIDWPVYFRPAGMANAIAVTDAVTFRGAPTALLDSWATGDHWLQLLIRAFLYRLGPTGFIASRNRLMGSLVTHAERARPAVDAVLARAD